MRGVALLVVLAGCGRFGFGNTDPPDDGGGSGSDGDVVGDGPRDGTLGDDAGPSCEGYKVCDAFEDPAFDPLWTISSAATTLDTTRAHRGIRSVRVHTAAFPANTDSYEGIYDTSVLMTSTTFWVRAWFWLSALPATGNGLELMTAERAGNAGDYVFVFSDETHLYSQYASYSQVSQTTVPIGSWFCVVWKVVRSTTNTGSLEMTGDVPMIVMPNRQTDSATNPMNLITIGTGFASSNTPSAQPAMDLWIDDVIIHDAPVGCTD
ncbi:MAG TPA: hypothetical protein VIV11_28200 [Kofleriaceae bacterium]